MTQNRGTAQLAPARADLPIPATTARTPAVRRSRLTGRPALYLLASLVVSLLAASAAPTPLYAIYQRMWGFTPITITIVFGVYAVAVLVALLTLGRLSDSIGRRPVTRDRRAGGAGEGAADGRRESSALAGASWAVPRFWVITTPEIWVDRSVCR